MPVLKPIKLIENRVKAIRDYHGETGIAKAQLDVSGGVDSAVMLALLAKALGPANVTAVFTDIDSSGAAEERAYEVAEEFDVELINLDLTKFFHKLIEKMEDALWAAGYDEYEIEDLIEKDPTVLGSIRSCLRAPIGRGFNRLTGGGIRHGTGNECEDRWLRFYQKGGDGEVDTNPIAMLSKGEVYQLAIALGVPNSILRATPSPDLHGQETKHNDEDELKSIYGMDLTYSRVDRKSGEYTSVGTIERISRALDYEQLDYFSKDTLYKNIHKLYFYGYSEEEMMQFLELAKKIEKSTRHKFNPNCSALGSRGKLVQLGIITNDLPKI